MPIIPVLFRLKTGPETTERDVTLNTFCWIERLSTSLVMDEPMLSVVSSQAVIAMAAMNNAVNSLKIFIILEM